jgi:hypothetical protein
MYANPGLAARYLLLAWLAWPSNAAGAEQRGELERLRATVPTSRGDGARRRAGLGFRWLRDSGRPLQFGRERAGSPTSPDGASAGGGRVARAQCPGEASMQLACGHCTTVFLPSERGGQLGRRSTGWPAVGDPSGAVRTSASGRPQRRLSPAIRWRPVGYAVVKGIRGPSPPKLEAAAGWLRVTSVRRPSHASRVRWRGCPKWCGEVELSAAGSWIVVRQGQSLGTGLYVIPVGPRAR